MATKETVYTATGRRKTAVARVRLSSGVGKVFVNGKEFSVYFPTEANRNYVEQPLRVTETLGQFDINAKVDGGGQVGQAGALRHGIARALINASEDHKEALKSAGCLTRDPRMKERKKPGQPGARKRFQFSKR